MTCSDRRAQLVAYQDDELDATERHELKAHLEGCAVCRSALSTERELSRALGSLPAIETPASFEARFWARIAREQEPPRGGVARLLTRRLALALGGAAAVTAAVVLALRGRTPPETDLPIVSSTRDLELLEDPDLELIEMVDVLLELEGDQG